MRSRFQGVAKSVAPILLNQPAIAKGHNNPHLPGRHGDVVERQPCGGDGTLGSPLVVLLLVVHRAVLLARRHGAARARVGKSKGGAIAVWQQLTAGP